MGVADNINYDLVPQEIKDKVKKWEANKPEEKQVSALNDLQAVLEHLVITMNDNQDSTEETVKSLGALLTDMRTSLAELNKKEAPESPDYAAPVVAAVTKLETALTSALEAVEVKPEFTPTIHVDAPQVNVSPPGIDLKGVEQAVAGLSSSFKAAIASMPEAPETDFSPLVAQLQTMSEQLASIETATRLKPQAPSSMKVTNLDGSQIGSVPVLTAKRIDTTVANTIYIGTGPIHSVNSGPVWQIKKIDTTNGADITWADGNSSYDNVWDNRTSLSYA